MLKRVLSLLLACFLLMCIVSCARTPENPVEDQPAVSDPALPGTDESTVDESDEGTTAEKDEPPVVEKQTASFFATGDNLIHTGIWRQANRNVGGSGDGCRMDSEYDFLPFYEAIADSVKAADIAFLNQETLVAADEENGPFNYPTFNTPRACGDAMIELGFDVVNVANNHMLDMQAAGLKNSVEYWRSKESMTQIGAYLDEADYNTVRIVEKNGVKIAFLAYVEDANNSGRGLEIGISNYHNYSSLGLYIPAMNEEELTRQVEDAKKQADFVVVAFHWGVENSSSVSPAQTRYAELCATLGVDVVLGSHPHVLQPMEWKESSSAASGRTLVVYSLGNMISLMESTAGNLLGGALTLDFVKEGDNCSLENVVLSPVVTHCSASYRQIALYRLENYTDEIYRTHYIHSHLSTTVSDFYQMMVDRIPREFWGRADYSKAV